jgi:hypothetical protein
MGAVLKHQEQHPEQHPDTAQLLPRRRLADVLVSRAPQLTQAFRVRAAGDAGPVPQLEGVVEPLLRELGHSLAEPHDLPGAAWGRTGGLLRISHARGEEGLSHEFHLLRHVLAQVSQHLNAPPEELKAVFGMLRAAEAHAVAVSRHRVAQPHLPPPLARFGGVVVEVP